MQKKHLIIIGAVVVALIVLLVVVKTATKPAPITIADIVTEANQIKSGDFALSYTMTVVPSAGELVREGEPPQEPDTSKQPDSAVTADTDEVTKELMEWLNGLTIKATGQTDGTQTLGNFMINKETFQIALEKLFLIDKKNSTVYINLASLTNMVGKTNDFFSRNQSAKWMQCQLGNKGVEVPATTTTDEDGNEVEVPAKYTPSTMEAISQLISNAFLKAISDNAYSVVDGAYVIVFDNEKIALFIDELATSIENDATIKQLINQSEINISEDLLGKIDTKSSDKATAMIAAFKSLAKTIRESDKDFSITYSLSYDSTARNATKSIEASFTYLNYDFVIKFSYSISEVEYSLSPLGGDRILSDAESGEILMKLMLTSPQSLFEPVYKEEPVVPIIARRGDILVVVEDNDLFTFETNYILASGVVSDIYYTVESNSKTIIDSFSNLYKDKGFSQIMPSELESYEQNTQEYTAASIALIKQLVNEHGSSPNFIIFRADMQTIAKYMKMAKSAEELENILKSQ